MSDMPVTHDTLLRSSLQRLLWHTPLLVPLVTVGCVIARDSVIAWVIGVVALTIAHGISGRRRIVLCSLLCGALVLVSQSLRQQEEAGLESLLSRGRAVDLQGTVVKRLARGCVVQTGWTGVRVALRGDMPWRVGDEVRFVAEAQPVTPPPVQGMFSMEGWMRSQGICAHLAYLQGECTGESFGWYRLVSLAEDVRSALADRLMPAGTEQEPARQVLCALVLGEKERSEADTIETFRRGGCLHIFAVSGLHVGLVSGMLWVLLRLCRVRPRVGRYILLIVTGIYVVSTGLAVPALRAYLMLAVLLSGLILRRRTGLFNTWCFAALLILMIQPWQLFQAGFQLSFAIYAAICLSLRYCMGAQRWLGPDPYIPARLYTRGERLIASADAALRGCIIVSLSAWIISLPFSIAHFHVVNTASYIVNILISPLLPIVMLCGILVIFLGWAPVLGAVLHGAAVKSASALIWLVGVGGAIPGAFLPAAPSAPPGDAMIACLSYGKSFCILGNPGLLIGDTRREADARFYIEPALFHAGYAPAMHSGKAGAAAPIYRRTWPGMIELEPPPPGRVDTMRTSAGSYTFYYPPRARASSAESSQPVVVWQAASGARVIYIGNASMSTLESLPAGEQRADVLILGYNPQEPVLDTELLRSFGAGEIVLLPSAAKRRYEESHLGAAKLHRLSPQENPLYTLH